MNLMNKPPLGLKPDKEPKTARKGMRTVSKKRQARKASPEGKAGIEHMGRVKQLPCVICLAPPPSDAHHVICGRYGTNKAPDTHVIPLCKAHHQNGPEAIHNGKSSWVEKFGQDTDYLPVVADMLAGELNR